MFLCILEYIRIYLKFKSQYYDVYIIWFWYSLNVLYIYIRISQYDSILFKYFIYTHFQLSTQYTYNLFKLLGILEIIENVFILLAFQNSYCLYL